MRTAVYIRVSTDEQMKDGYSIVDQENSTKEYCQNNNHEIIGIYRDEGVSGDLRPELRPAMSEILTDIQEKRIQLVIASQMTRLGRKWFTLVEDEVLARGAVLRTLDGVIGPESTDDTEFSADVISAAEKFLKAKQSKHMRKVQVQKIKDGELVNLGGFLPYGYKHIQDPDKPKRKKVVVDKDESQIVKDIFRWYTKEGMSLRGVAQRLMDLGILTRYNKIIQDAIDSEDTDTIQSISSLKKHTESIWYPSVISKMIRNELYVGMYVYGKTYTRTRLQHERKIGKREKKKVRKDDISDAIRVAHPELRIVEDEIFEEAIKRLEKNKSYRSPEFRKYTLTSRMKCTKCGKNYAGHTSKGYRYYRCGSSNGCKSRRFNAAKMEIPVAMFLTDLLTNPDSVNSLITESVAEAQANVKDLERELGKVIKSLKVEQEKEQRLTDLYLDGTFDKGKLDNKRDNIHKKVSALKMRQDALTDAIRPAKFDTHKMEGELKLIRESMEKVLDNKNWKLFEALHELTNDNDLVFYGRNGVRDMTPVKIDYPLEQVIDDLHESEWVWDTALPALVEAYNFRAVLGGGETGWEIEAFATIGNESIHRSLRYDTFGTPNQLISDNESTRIVHMREQEKKTWPQIGAEFGMSRTWASRRYKKIREDE